MQSNDYFDKYKSVFQSVDIDSVMTGVLKTPNLNFINDKYTAIIDNQVRSRSGLFRETLKKAIAENDASVLHSFVVELNEICIRNSNVNRTALSDAYYIMPPSLGLKTLVESYLAILVFTNFINKHRVALDFLNDMVGIPNTWCVQKCVECYIIFINKFDDLSAEKIADEFYSCAAQIAPEDAWVRFRKFRLGLGCHKNRDFINLDSANFKRAGEGASIYSVADEQLKKLFNQQAATFTQRKK